MVRIRLKRTGRKHKPSYRVAAVDVRSTRDGRVLEELGFYDPAHKVPAMRYGLKLDRIDHWMKAGAQPSDTVRELVKRARKAAPTG